MRRSFEMSKLTEEEWLKDQLEQLDNEMDIAKKAGTINFNSLKRIANRKAIQIYKDKLTGDISIADREN